MKTGTKYLIGVLGVVIFMAALITWAQSVYQKRVVAAYDSAVNLIKEGKYEEAIEKIGSTKRDVHDDITNATLNGVEPKTQYYKDTWAICLYATAMQEYSDGESPLMIQQYLDTIPIEYDGEFKDDIETLRKTVASMETDAEKQKTQEELTKNDKPGSETARKKVYGPPVEDYNVAEYSNPEDFYYDNDENFEDYDSAREFYMEFHP